ncbi:M20/M25/M40 family metallo-hydrolase [Temperatibacter marinus]|uniref:M20/M25/M40 family metallo-hydrolase n=1 Tax=Temperatibacter marinus TaxID=1456591 RepID=A0AA52EKA8_9PROT|nr:M20/M25/M40 family metallo-hydrolase [Temperatibacter marinus]WND03794.1 M20/M25/M40 family metallo-hydrolase [Temperatibacter marinus]
MKRKLILAVMAPFALAACMDASAPKKMTESDLPDISADRIRAHLEFLADDVMQGRNTGSDEYMIAANYVATHYKMMGLKPGGENGSYMQHVAFSSFQPSSKESSLVMSAGGKDMDLAHGKDFAFIPSIVKPVKAVSATKVTFVGYGTTKEVEGLDLTDKVVVYLSGKRSDIKGASAKIMLKTAAHEKRSAYAGYAGYYGRKSLSMLKPDGSPFGGDDGSLSTVFLSLDATNKLLAAAGQKMEDLEKAAKADVFKASTFDVNIDLKTKVDVAETVKSPNVVGILEGSDPVLKDEYVVITAHLDHVGEGKGNCAKRAQDTSKEGDMICNGAMDNASGISTMLEAARAFSNDEKAPKRSVMFIALTAEEKGLLGAQYYVNYPTVPLKSLVANVNLDMPILLYDFADVVAFGGEHSTMGEIASKALSKLGVTLAEDPMPEERLFTRSDHYRFVQKGIPSVFLMSGPNEVGKPEGEGLKTFRKFLATNYHSPADDLFQPIRWDVAAKFSMAKYLIIKAVANADQKPLWYKDSEFGTRFAPDAEKAENPAKVEKAEKE